MAAVFVLFSALIVAVLASSDESVREPKRLSVQVYYEALCGDSMNFIREQLYPSMMRKNRMDYMDLQLIPYGKVETEIHPKTGKKRIYCQHGPPECALNAIHGCIIENYSIRDQMRMIYCLMESYNTNITTCARVMKIDLYYAYLCKGTRPMMQVLEKYAALTDPLKLTFIPSIGIDGIFNRTEQSDLFNNFDSTFCRKYYEKYNIRLDKCP